MEYRDSNSPYRLALIFLIAVLASWFGQSGCAGGTSGTGGRNFSGTVRTASGEPVEGAAVSVAGGEARVLTDSSGSFTIESDSTASEVQLEFASDKGAGVVSIDGLPADAEGAIVNVVIDTAAEPQTGAATEGEPGDSTAVSDDGVVELKAEVQIVGGTSRAPQPTATPAAVPPTSGGDGAGATVPSGEACGPVTCAAGQVCCNESCGICTEPGGACTQQFCLPSGDTPPGGAEVPPGSFACGPNFCASEEVCCNQSCGICTPPGGACIELFCE